MPIYKTTKPNVASIGLHGHDLEVVDGFVEISDADLTPEIHDTITKLLGFAVASEDDVNASVSEGDEALAEQRIAAERAEIIEKFKAAGIKIDGRKSLAWLKERFDEAVEQGLIPAQAVTGDAGEETKQPEE